MHSVSQQPHVNCPDTTAYLNVMEEIKRRSALFEELTNRRKDLVWDVPTIEAMALQVRMCLELVSLASIAANISLFEENTTKYRKHWNPRRIIKDVSRINPNFFPIPLVEHDASSDGNKSMRALSYSDEQSLTCEELVELHGKCGDLLHAQNPFDTHKLHRQYEQDLRNWMEKILLLLKVHKIRLLDDKVFYLVHFRTRGDGMSRMHQFVRVED